MYCTVFQNTEMAVFCQQMMYLLLMFVSSGYHILFLGGDGINSSSVVSHCLRVELEKKRLKLATKISNGNWLLWECQTWQPIMITISIAYMLIFLALLYTSFESIGIEKGWSVAWVTLHTLRDQNRRWRHGGSLCLRPMNWTAHVHPLAPSVVGGSHGCTVRTVESRRSQVKCQVHFTGFSLPDILLYLACL